MSQTNGPTNEETMPGTASVTRSEGTATQTGGNGPNGAPNDAIQWATAIIAEFLKTTTAGEIDKYLKTLNRKWNCGLDDNECEAIFFATVHTLWEALVGLRKGPKNPQAEVAWLKGVAKNHYRNAHRKLHRNGTVVVPNSSLAEQIDPKGWPKSADLAKIKQVIDTTCAQLLDDEEREVWRRIVMNPEKTPSFAKLARELRMHRKTVKIRYESGRLKIQAALESKDLGPD
jgi:DNA-directed RNA polymerase specialized sigma24 family protein